MQHSFAGVLAAICCLAFTGPAFAQFTGGVIVATGDVNGDSAATLKSRMSGAKMQFQASDIAFGAARSATPPARGGPGVAHIRIINGSAGEVLQWFRKGANGRARADGQDLLIVNNGDGSDFAVIVFSDLIVSSYQSSGANAQATVKYRAITVRYTVQADDHAAN